MRSWAYFHKVIYSKNLKPICILRFFPVAGGIFFELTICICAINFIPDCFYREEWQTTGTLTGQFNQLEKYISKIQSKSK
jgi:hypothetical protein